MKDIARILYLATIAGTVIVVVTLCLSFVLWTPISADMYRFAFLVVLTAVVSFFMTKKYLKGD